ncbi:MAG: ABC transporter substrate-binding protein [archaeon]
MKKKNNLLIIGIVCIILILFAVIILSSNNSKEIKIGVIGPLSGDAAIYGRDLQNSLNYGVDEINQNGGINGKIIKLIFEDSKCNEKDALTSVQKLINIDKVNIIFGGVCSSETLGAVSITEANKVILFSSGSSSPKISEIGNYVFRNYPSEDMLAKELAELVYKDGYKKVAVILENQEFPVSVLEVFKKRFNELGGEIVIEQKYPPETKDYRTYLMKIKDSNADCLLFDPHNSSNGGLLVKQAKELGINLPYYGTAQLVGQEALKIAGDSINSMKVVDTPILDKENRKAKDFLDKYYLKYEKAEIEYFIGALYDATYIIKDAVENCKDDKDTDCIKNYLYNMPKYNGVIGSYNFDKYGDCIGINSTVRQIKDAEKGIIEIIN